MTFQEPGDRVMRSRIFQGHISHARVGPVRHSFRYPIFLFAFDLDELPLLDSSVAWFGLNKLRPVSLREADYLPQQPGGASLKDRLLRFLSDRVDLAKVARIELVTAARYFNYVFNPVSFYYVYRGDESIQAIVAEINNTFGENHLYVIDHPEVSRDAGFNRDTQRKNFHVSPFYNMDGDYDFWFSDIARRLDIRINVLKDGRPKFLSRLTGDAVPLDSGNLAKTVLRYPATAALTTPRILWQAAKLHYGKGLPVYTKPTAPSSELTVTMAPPGLFQRVSQSLVMKYLSNMRRGTLRVTLPDRSEAVFGGVEPGTDGHMIIRSHDFFTRCVTAGDVGFGEAFQKGDWDSPDLTATLRHFLENADHNDDKNFKAAALGNMVNRLRHIANKNTLTGARRNIQSHYCLSNEFFELFLDESMTYSSGIYRRPEDTLTDAQRNKLREMIRKARIGPEHHVLEIGCGWGSFALEAVRTTGCRVTGLTLSQRQHDMARARIAEAGLSDRIDIQLRDFRQMEGTFDRIVSIEMLEAVGHENLPVYFASLDRLLKRDGLAAIQVITIPDQRYDDYRRSCDWIQKYIFPGAVVPSLTAIQNAVTEASPFVIERLDNIGIHYARTLREWRERFLARRDDVRKLGFDPEFLRVWEYYLCYCEAAFASRMLGDLQFVLTRPNNGTLPAYEDC